MRKFGDFDERASKSDCSLSSPNPKSKMVDKCGNNETFTMRFSSYVNRAAFLCYVGCFQQNTKTIFTQFQCVDMLKTLRLQNTLAGCAVICNATSLVYIVSIRYVGCYQHNGQCKCSELDVNMPGQCARVCSWSGKNSFAISFPMATASRTPLKCGADDPVLLTSERFWSSAYQYQPGVKKWEGSGNVIAGENDTCLNLHGVDWNASSRGEIIASEYPLKIREQSIGTKLNAICEIGITEDDCLSLSANWSSTTQSCFKYYDDTYTWDEGEVLCATEAPSGLKGRLAFIQTAAVYDIVKSMVTKDAWLGLKARNPYNCTQYSGSGNSFPYKDQWGFYEGTAVTNLSWVPFEVAVDSDPPHCMRLRAGGSYDDIQCYMKFRAICEFTKEEPEIDECNSNPCRNGGTCTDIENGYTCTCKPTFTGEHCGEIDECNSNPCRNGGTCTDMRNGYTCTCKPTFTGQHCDEIDECNSNPCRNGGTCTDIGNGYICTCEPTFTGQHCEEFDECNSNPCRNGGTCTDMGNGYTCTCKPTFTGQHCDDQDRCYQHTCVNGGTCKPVLFYYECICPPGFMGMRCELAKDSCHQNKCANGATCKTVLFHYECICPSGFWGMHCELAKDSCHQHKCANGATCKPVALHYECICPPGFWGMHCEQDTDECALNALKLKYCKNKAKCWNKPEGGWQCNCTLGWEGTFCEEEINECESNPCHNNATCIDKFAEYICKCVPGFTGTNCETDIDECESYPCVNNATCIDKINHFFCNCTTGWNGTYCETEIKECDSNPCEHNATCNDCIGFYTCDCHPGTNGTHCEINPDECLSNPCQNNGTCENHFNRYVCVCPPDYTHTNCHMLTTLWLLMVEFETTLNLEELLKDILTASSTIVDAVPFVVAGMNQSFRMQLSWNYTDVFEHCRFEDAPCNLKKDVQMWEEPAMGNCFTFNFENRSDHFKVVKSGARYGFDVWLNIHQEEYVPWSDVAGFKIFIHNQSEQVFSESLSYYVPGGAHVGLGLKYTEFRKLPAPYSDCISDKNSVKYYYYHGFEYTKEACIRSCLQEELRRACGCADPRYARPPDLHKCPLENRTCVNKFLDSKGDPTLWPDCVCPSSCTYGEYGITVTRSQYRGKIVDCLKKKSNKTEYEICLQNVKSNKVRVTVYFESNDYFLFQEVPQIQFFDMLGNVGGQMGILAGISAISIVELLFALFRVIFVFITNHGGCSENNMTDEEDDEDDDDYDVDDDDLEI